MSGAAVGAIIGAASSAAQAAAAARAAKKQRQFSAQQRATAFQVQRQDLEAAGYNPLYAFWQGGQGAPLAQYQQPNFSGIGEAGSRAGKSYQEIKNLKADHDLKRNSAMNQNAQGNAAAAAASNSSALSNLHNTENLIKKEQLKGAKIEGKIDSGGLGTTTRKIKRVIDVLAPAVNSALRMRGGR